MTDICFFLRNKKKVAVNNKLFPFLKDKNIKVGSRNLLDMVFGVFLYVTLI